MPVTSVFVFSIFFKVVAWKMHNFAFGKRVGGSDPGQLMRMSGLWSGASHSPPAMNQSPPPAPFSFLSQF